MRKLSRHARTATAASMAIALGLTLGACGNNGGSEAGNAGSGGDPNSAQLSWSWWGSDPRHKANQAIIEQYQAANPGITIKGEYGDFGGYWDKLATTTAGGDAPDVITMDEKYLQEYAGRGALADLNKLPNLDLSKFDESALALGEYEDGLYGLSTGQNAYVVMVNEDLFAKAGIPLPDDTTWTWDEYYELSRQLKEKLGGDVSGTEYGAQDVDLRIWLRQHDESLYNEEEGTVGYSKETAAAWFQHLLDVRDQGGGPTAAEFVEDSSGTFEAGSFPTNKAAMGWYWSNQLAALRTATGSNISMMRVPSESGDAKENGMYYKASMYWSISSQSENQEAAANFVNYLANNEEAAKKMLVDRGVPVNPDMAEAVKPELNESDRTVVEFLDEIRPDMEDAPKPSPVGAGGVQDVVDRFVSEVLFGNLTPEQAADQMTSEIDGMIEAG